MVKIEKLGLSIHMDRPQETCSAFETWDSDCVCGWEWLWRQWLSVWQWLCCLWQRVIVSVTVILIVTLSVSFNHSFIALCLWPSQAEWKWSSLWLSFWQWLNRHNQHNWTDTITVSHKHNHCQSWSKPQSKTQSLSVTDTITVSHCQNRNYSQSQAQRFGRVELKLEMLPLFSQSINISYVSHVIAHTQCDVSCVKQLPAPVARSLHRPTHLFQFQLPPLLLSLHTYTLYA